MGNRVSKGEELPEPPHHPQELRWEPLWASAYLNGKIEVSDGPNGVLWTCLNQFRLHTVRESNQKQGSPLVPSVKPQLWGRASARRSTPGYIWLVFAAVAFGIFGQNWLCSDQKMEKTKLTDGPTKYNAILQLDLFS